MGIRITREVATLREFIKAAGISAVELAELWHCTSTLVDFKLRNERTIFRMELALLARYVKIERGINVTVNQLRKLTPNYRDEPRGADRWRAMGEVSDAPDGS